MVISDVTTFPTLDRIVADDQPRVGGKAYNCARLKQAGVPDSNTSGANTCDRI